MIPIPLVRCCSLLLEWSRGPDRVRCTSDVAQSRMPMIFSKFFLEGVFNTAWIRVLILLFGRRKLGDHGRRIDRPSIPVNRLLKFQFLPGERSSQDPKKNDGQGELHGGGRSWEQKEEIIDVDPSSMSEVQE